MTFEKSDFNQRPSPQARMHWPVHLWIVTVGIISGAAGWYFGQSATFQAVEIGLVIFAMVMTLTAAFLAYRTEKAGDRSPLLAILAFSLFSQVAFVAQLLAHR